MNISSFDMIADAMDNITEEDWRKIFAATRDRLIHCEFDGQDTSSNRVLCEMIVSNALFDIRDARNKII